MVTYWQKITNSSQPLWAVSFSALTRGDPLQIYGKALRILKLESSKKSIKHPILAFKVIQGHWIRRQSRASVRLSISD